MRVELSSPDPAWPEMFEVEAARIRSALGRRVRRLEHVGSTSVPDFPAKPIIDIVLAVADSTDEDSYLPSLMAAGYVFHLREPEWFEHRLFKGTGTKVNLHVFGEGAEEIDRMVIFRDRLRAEPADRNLYARTKYDLASREWDDVQAYADAKSEVVAEILGRAMVEGSSG